MTTEPLLAEKNILGYTLKERIGHGGFGEVWSAIAPGGLQKAIKIVYGYHDEKRAQAELKAMDRVKELRHPFLLSLERIEVFEGQLIVVSELADKSLADLFNEYLANDEPGVPRDELLKFMRSVADALDYISDEHGLQHLDIKPENLLIVGGHVKVADFGLIKDLQDASQSLMSGMTPAYAAPELFDGRPGTKSDQYSLAIVYQEMLTGVRPFPGSTPAQLAAQHVHGKPNLRPLPPSDQAIIARALSKDPGVRFESCRALAEELSNRKRTTKKAIRRIQSPTRQSTDTECQTVNVFEREATALISSDGLPLQASEIKSLDPPECDAESATMQPVLIVGVGSTANRVVKQLKQQMVARHNSMAEIPSVRMVCIDTDRNEITRLCMANDETTLSTEETLATPLSKPEAYRERADSRLSWISRRWIYNIPRSLQTEGLRPLGRLAFTDHFDPICNKIDEALNHIVVPEHLAETANTLEMNPGNLQPRVFIVTSISGGVGSGMTLDLAYTIKVLLAEHGLKTDCVTGIMLHSTYQRTRDPGLSAANAFAFLTELRHFVEHGFPGDSSIGLPEFEDEPPFDYTYFNELGNDLSQTEFESRLNSVAEYIYLSATSKCSAFYDRCRTLQSEIDHFSLRTFGLSMSGPGTSTTGTQNAQKVASSLIQRWIHGHPDSDFEASSEVDAAMAEMNLSSAQMHEHVRQQCEDAFEGGFSSITAVAKDVMLGGKSEQMANLESYLDGALGCPPGRKNSSHMDPEICLEMEDVLGAQAVVLGDQIATSILDLLNQKQLDISIAKAMLSQWNDKLETMSLKLNQASSECEQQSALLLSELARFTSEKTKGKKEDPRILEQVVQQYCELRFEEFAFRFSKHYLRIIRNGLTGVDSSVKQFGSSLTTVSQNFAVESDLAELLASEGSSIIDKLLTESIELDLENHVTRTEIQVYESLVKSMGGYPEVLNNQSCLYQRLPNEIITAAQRVLADAYKKVSLERVIAENHIGPEQLIKWLNEKVRHARPVIDDCGGASRVLLGLPALSTTSHLPEMLRRNFGLNVKPINGTGGSFVICFEAEDVGLANVAYRLLQARPDAVELVKRLHCRNDVEWSTLNDLL